eukprot:Skav227853  [mRNA]  locus=scaffold4698:134338:135302:- [translate_table: standard]
MPAITADRVGEPAATLPPRYWGSLLARCLSTSLWQINGSCHEALGRCCSHGDGDFV